MDTLDLVSLEWSSNDAFVAVWDSEVNVSFRLFFKLFFSINYWFTAHAKGYR